MIRNILWTILLLGLAGILINGAFYLQAAWTAPRTVFSAARGVITKSGAPLEGATVTRHVVMHSYTYQLDHTTTRRDGSFAFPQFDRPFSFWRLLPEEAVIDQSIVVRTADTEVVVLRNLRRDFLPGTECDGRELTLVIDLDKQSGCADVPARPSKPADASL